MIKKGRKFLVPALILFFLSTIFVVSAVSADEPSITMIVGKSEAVLGESVPISGTVSGVNTEKVYLLLSGNGLDEDGVTLANPNYRASEGKFTEVSVNSNGKWTYQWNTAILGDFNPGDYTIYAMTTPLTITDLKSSGEVYKSSSITVKPSSTSTDPYITISASPTGAQKGNPVRFTGYSAGKVSRIIYLFVTGPDIDENGAPLGDLSAKASDGKFSEVQLTSGSYIYTWDTSVVPPGDYTVYAVTGPSDLSNLDTSGNVYAKVSVSITGDSTGNTETKTAGVPSTSSESESSPATPLSPTLLISALITAFTVFRTGRK